MTVLRVLAAVLIMAPTGPWAMAAAPPVGGFPISPQGDQAAGTQAPVAVAVPSPLGTGPPEDPKTYRIQAGDIVSIQVFPVAEYSREVTVQPDGMIELQLLGALMARGLTPLQLRGVLEDSYKRYVANPAITVNVRRFSGRRVAIIGETRLPGLYEYRDGMRVLDLVTQTGGITDLAKTSRAHILRLDEKTGLRRIRIDLRRVLEGDASRNIMLAPGDTLVIPKGRLTRGTQWVNLHVLPWLGLIAAVSSIALLSR